MASKSNSAGTVDYQLVIYDELPADGFQGGRGRSILNDQLDSIRRAREAWGRPVRIALYSTGSAASSAKATLERRFKGDAEWSFYTRPVPVDTSPGAAVHKGLFAMYQPGDDR
jgi:hypothetical protein